MAIDPHAPEGAIFRRLRLDAFDAEQPFDGVIASRSLHHIADLAGAVNRIATLLEPSLEAEERGLIEAGELVATGWDTDLSCCVTVAVENTSAFDALSPL